MGLEEMSYRTMISFWLFVFVLSGAACTAMPESGVDSSIAISTTTKSVEQVISPIPTKLAVTITPTIRASESLPASATGTSVPVHNPSPSPTNTLTTTPTATPVVPLEGPLIGFFAQHLDGTNAILILDMGTETFRIVESELLDDAPGIKWQGNGCQLEVWFGDLFDLKGNVLSVPSDELDWDILAPQKNSRTYATRLSPDGLWLAYNIGYGGKIQIDMETEAEFNDIGIVSQANPEDPLFVTNSGKAGRFTWSADSQWLAYSDEDDRGIVQLYRFSPNNGAKEQLTFRSEALKTGHQVWSPDGRYIATSIRKGDVETERGGLEIVDLYDLSRREIMPDAENFSGVRRGQIWWSPESEMVMFSGTGW